MADKVRKETRVTVVTEELWTHYSEHGYFALRCRPPASWARRLPAAAPMPADQRHEGGVASGWVVRGTRAVYRVTELSREEPVTADNADNGC